MKDLVERVRSSNSRHIDQFLEMQRVWEQFRDLAARYEADLLAKGGTIWPTVRSGVAEQVTAARIEQLRKYLQGWEHAE